MVIVVVVRYKPTATARWALLFIVRAFFNDTITVAVWTGFHVRLTGMLPQPSDYIRWCFADPAIAARPHDVALPPKADIRGAKINVRFGPQADIDTLIRSLRLRAAETLPGWPALTLWPCPD